MDNQLWNYVITAVGLTGFFLAGKKVWWCWYVNIFNQLLWFTYGFVTHQWGFVVGTFAYSYVFINNAIDWTREHINSLPSVTPQWKFCPDWFHTRFHEGPPSSLPSMSFGFNFDATAFNSAMTETMRRLNNIRLTNATVSSSWTERSSVPWYDRYFGWIRPECESIKVHRNHTCICYLEKVTTRAKIGHITSVKQTDEGMFATAHIDRSTAAGRKAWEAISRPVSAYSLPGTGIECQSFVEWQGRVLSCEVSNHPAQFAHQAIMEDAVPKLKIMWSDNSPTMAEEIIS